MKFIKSAAVVALASGILSAGLFAASEDTQVVSFAVSAINELEVTGSPSLTITTATAGSDPDDVSDVASYAITTNEVGRKITAVLDEAMPTGVTLKANLAAPEGATSAGAVTLGTTAVDAVTGISTLNDPAKAITYTLSATAAAGVVAADTRTVTYTITAQ